MLAHANALSKGHDLLQKGDRLSTLDEKRTTRTAAAMDTFLAAVERRALRMVQIATTNSDDALDLVQDAMLKLVERYATKPESEWGPLFYRILQSRIRDWYRRTAVRRRWHVFIGKDDGDGDSVSVLESVPDPGAVDPLEHLMRTNISMRLEEGVRSLSLRQQQAFLLRAWEGMDVRQTAFAMGCSEGSVKTHYSRAVHALQDILEDHRP